MDLIAAVGAVAVSRYVASPGLLGFAVFALLGLALFFLIRSMNKHLRRVDVDGKRDEQ